jgi:hypothetical protein
MPLLTGLLKMEVTVTKKKKKKKAKMKMKMRMRMRTTIKKRTNTNPRMKEAMIRLIKKYFLHYNEINHFNGYVIFIKH